ncbi:prealbumin-like fold domain-containing protein [Enterococcus mundtii]|nr:prealbumin-like fold domain-containing protein [Enterococcus mundtii]
MIDEFLTDQEGKIQVENLPYGSYKFIETAQLDGYLPLEESIDFQLQWKMTESLLYWKPTMNGKIWY